MMTATLTRLSHTLTALSATGLGLYQVKEGIDKALPLGDFLWQLELWLSLTLLILSGMLYFAARIRFDWSTTIYPCLGIRRTDIPTYYQFIQRTLGDDIAPIERVYEWFDKNPEVLRAVYRETTRGVSVRRELIGFFTVFPLTLDCARLLEQNQINGTRLGADQMVARGARPAAIYIGAVGAPGMRARQQTLLAMMGYLAPTLDRRMPIFTRPTTEEGKRVAIKHHFVAIDPKAALGDSIYVRDATP